MSLFAGMHVLLCVLLVICLGGIPVPASARKEIPIAPLYPAVVREAIQCDVCAYVVANFQNQLDQIKMEHDALSIPVREDVMLDTLESLCNPLTENGEWIRRVVLQWDAPDSELATSVTESFNACNRTCRSVSDACDRVLDSEEADDLTAIYLREMAASGGEPLEFDVVERVIKQVCNPSEACTRRRALLQALSAAAKETPSVFSDIKNEVPVPIASEEMDVERMMHSMLEKEGRRADVLGRDEIVELQDAIARGDRQRAKEIDPKSMDLSEVEFQELRRMLAAQFQDDDDDDGYDLDI